MAAEDGRLGLIDYGMVGRLTAQDRGNIARVLLALGAKDEQRVAQLAQPAKRGVESRLKLFLPVVRS